MMFCYCNDGHIKHIENLKVETIGSISTKKKINKMQIKVVYEVLKSQYQLWVSIHISFYIKSTKNKYYKILRWIGTIVEMGVAGIMTRLWDLSFALELLLEKDD